MRTLLLFCSLLASWPVLYGSSASTAAANEKIRIEFEQQQRRRDQERIDYQRKVDDARRDKKQAQQDSRIEQLEAEVDGMDDAGYDYRKPTQQEVNAMEKKWNADHPFTSSAEMPKFANQRIKVPRNTTAQLERKLAEQELAITRLQQTSQQGSGTSPLDPPAVDPYDENSVMTPGVRALVERMRATSSTNAPQIQKQPEPAAPSTPNPRGVTMRTLSDGRVIAIIGGKNYQFASQAEALAFIEKTLK